MLLELGRAEGAALGRATNAPDSARNRVIRQAESAALPLVRKYDMLLHMKRTTLLIDETLYAELKRRAAAEGRTLTGVVETALRLGLQAGGGRRRTRIQLPSYDLGPFLVDPSERRALDPSPKRGGGA